VLDETTDSSVGTSSMINVLKLSTQMRSGRLMSRDTNLYDFSQCKLVRFLKTVNNSAVFCVRNSVLPISTL
jgi:hypothetical protein